MNKRLENRIKKHEKEGNSIRKSIIKKLAKVEFTFITDTYATLLLQEDALLGSIKNGVLFFDCDDKSFSMPIDEFYLWELITIYNIVKMQEGI